MKSKVVFIFCVLAFLFKIVLPVYSQDEEATSNALVVRLVNEGIELHKNKDYLGAIKSFEEAFEIEPLNVLVRQNLSIAHNNFGKYLAERTDYENALKEFRLAIYYDPTNKTADTNMDALLKERGINSLDPQVRVQLGDKLRQDAKFELALVEYKKAQELSKQIDPNILINIGDIHYILYLRDGQKTNDIYKALDSYKKSLELKETAKAHIKVGDAQLALKDVVSAIDHYKKAVQLEPGSQEALTANIRGWNEAVRLAPLVCENHLGLAQAFQMKKDLFNAEEHYNQALKLDPDNPIAQKGLESLLKDKIKLKAVRYLEKAIKLHSEGKYDNAIEAYLLALELTPDDAVAHYNVGTAFQAKGDLDHAEKAYKKSLELDPKNDKAKAALEILIKQFNLKKVNELISRSVELQNSGNFQEAITTYLAAISISPNNPSLYYNLGTAYQASGDLTNAQLQYKKAIELDKSNQSYVSALSLVQEALAEPLIKSAITKQSASDISGAISDYSKALDYTPLDPQTHFNLATAYQADKQNDLAIMSYLKALELDSLGQADAFFFLGTLYEENKNNKTAIENYQKYLQKAPNGSYIKEATERINYLKTIKQ